MQVTTFFSYARGLYTKLSVILSLLDGLQNENEEKRKTLMTQSFNHYSENETEAWRQNILNQFSPVSSFSFHNLSIICYWQTDLLLKLLYPMTDSGLSLIVKLILFRRKRSLSPCKYSMTVFYPQFKTQRGVYM